MKVSWSRRAQADLRDLARQVSIDNPRAALALWDRIDQRAARLAEHPEIGRPGRVRGTRELVVTRTPYLVIYRVAEGFVFVERILHGAQRWPPRGGG